MQNWKDRTIAPHYTIKQALALLDEIGVASNVLFVVDAHFRLLGSVTDGDIRRGLLRDLSLADPITDVMNTGCKRLVNYNFTRSFVKMCRDLRINYIPVVTAKEELISVINMQDFREVVPVDAVIMAGGKGERLMPLTKETPKPMLKVGTKPILEHNIDRLQKFGVRNINISINYLGHIIRDFFKDGTEKGLNIQYVEETQPLGTIGSVSLVPSFSQDVILLMNSDLLTNIDFADFYQEFVKSDAAMGVATIPHHVDLPYAILELQDTNVTSLKEKPRYTYFANAGIYLIKEEVLSMIPRNTYYNATDLMERILQEKRGLFHYPILGYWLDIGRMNDYYRAQEDVKHIYW